MRAESFADMIAFTEGLAGTPRAGGNHMSLDRLHELRAGVARDGGH